MLDLLTLILLRAAEYALVAVGFSLVFGTCRVLNLMHGSYFMLGAYAAYLVANTLQVYGASPSTSAAMALALAPLLVALLGIGFFKLLQLTHRTSPPQVLAISVAANLFIMKLIGYAFGTTGASVPPVGHFETQIGGLALRGDDLLVVVAGVTSIALLDVWLRRSRLGLALRAAADNPRAAAFAGIDAGRMLVVAIGISALLASLAGALRAPSLTLAPHMWIRPLIISLTVVVFGGLGNVRGTVLAAILLASAESASSWFLGEASAQYLLFVLVLAGLIILPRGLSGRIRYEFR